VLRNEGSDKKLCKSAVLPFNTKISHHSGYIFQSDISETDVTVSESCAYFYTDSYDLKSYSLVVIIVLVYSKLTLSIYFISHYQINTFS